MKFCLLLLLLLNTPALAIRQALKDQKSLTYDTAATLKLTQYRQQHRRTKDGRLCAAAFVQDGQTYTDCTTAKSPDGTTGKEWCYVEPQLLKANGSRWDFCRPVVDYDYVRKVATEALRAKIADADRMTAKLSEEKTKLDDVMDRYNKVCKIELNETERTLTEMTNMLQHASHALANAEQAKQTIASLQNSVEQMESKMRDELARSLKQPENCRAVRGYEDEDEPDGLVGTYYPTPRFEDVGGKRQVRLDPSINFYWNTKSPAPGIPIEAFSVRWEGYLLPPDTGEYRFSVETRCGARLYLNKRLVLLDRMPSTPYAELGPGDGNGEVPMLPLSEMWGRKPIVSKPIILSGGIKVPIRLEMIHASFLLYSDSMDASINLQWSTPGGNFTTIPSDYLFSGNIGLTLKLSRLSTSTTDIRYLLPGVKPFRDVEDYYIGDVPMYLEDSKLIRMNMANQLSGSAKTGEGLDELVFETNIPADMYLAYDSEIQSTKPINSCGEQTVAFHLAGDKDDRISIFVAESPSARASEAHYYSIFKGTLPTAGLYRFRLQHTLSPFLVFLRPLPQGPDLCTGETMVLSDPTSHSFQSCSESSSDSVEYTCQSALNLRHLDKPYGVWRSSKRIASGLGQYIEITFRGNVRISAFKFKPLDDPMTWPSKLLLSYGVSLPPQEITLLFTSDMDILTYDLAPVTTNYIKIEVQEMYASGQFTGGSLEVLGSECADTTVASQAGATVVVQAFSIKDCGTRISEINDFPPLRPGLLLDIHCPASCSPDTGVVFGTNIYAPESSLCLSAQHAGVCTSMVGACSATLKFISGQNRYVGSRRNSIESKNHGPHDIAFVVEPLLSTSPYASTSLPNSRVVNGEKTRIIVFNAAKPPQQLPPDITVDAGAVFGGASSQMGWLRSPPSINCNTMTSKGSSIDELDPIQSWILTGGFEFPPATVSAACKDNTRDCKQNSWSIILTPQTSYDVVIMLGHACQPAEGATRRYDIYVNGVPGAENVRLGPGQFHYVTLPKIKTQDDGKITIAGSCTNAVNPVECADGWTSIIQLKISLSK